MLGEQKVMCDVHLSTQLKLQQQHLDRKPCHVKFPGQADQVSRPLQTQKYQLNAKDSYSLFRSIGLRSQEYPWVAEGQAMLLTK